MQRLALAGLPRILAEPDVDPFAVLLGYVPGEQPRMANLVKLNTNESPFGPSAFALEAMRAAAADTLRFYPDPEATELREALAAHHGVKPEQVFVGNGSDEVLGHAEVRLTPLRKQR